MTEQNVAHVPEKTTQIEIILPAVQLPLIPELHEVFPDLFLVRWSNMANIYHASLYLYAPGAPQIQFLHKHGIAYIQREKQREHIIREFFKGVELEGNPLASVSIRRVLDLPDYHGVKLKTSDDEVCLRFPPQWNFGQEYPESNYAGWLYVCEGHDAVYAAMIGLERRVLEIVKQTESVDEMEAWLIEYGYSQEICLTAKQSVYGLYRQNIREAKVHV
jgi:hypothetical protein